MKKLTTLLACTVVFMLSLATLAAQTVDTIDPALKSRIDRIAAQVLEQTGVPSASVAIVQHGKLVYTRAYGEACLDPAMPATPQMRYSIGSISKQFTAAAILLLQEEGKLSLDDAVGKYVPGLTEGDKVTIREILSHTSGYQDYWPEDYVMTPMLVPETSQQILDTWAKKPLDFEPGTQWQYSNTNYVIAGRIVENITGHPLMDLLTQRIFRPLGMKSVWNSDQEKLTHADATAYYRHALGPLRVAPKEGRGWMFAAGELAMTSPSGIRASSRRPFSSQRATSRCSLRSSSKTAREPTTDSASRSLSAMAIAPSSTAARSPASSQTMRCWWMTA
jgi:CubicO group peptidase (beta-lactamase class C family)